MQDRIAVIVGHKKTSKGAVNYLGESEFDFNMRIGEKLTNKLGQAGFRACLCFKEDFESISSIGEDVAEDDPHLSVELHFNSFHEKITGKVTEVLIRDKSHNEDKASVFCQLFLEEMGVIFGFGSRGCKKIRRGQRGYINLDSIERCNSNITSVLVEPVFGNFETKEAAIFFASEKEYINLLFRVIANWFIYCKNDED